MPTKVTAWSCSFGCHRKILRSKKDMREHETRCFHNPANRACQTCGNWHATYETIYDPYHGGNPGDSDYEAQVNYCSVGIDVKESLHNQCGTWVQRENDYQLVEP